VDDLECLQGCDEPTNRAEPYDKIVGELPEMRRDTVSLVKQAVAEIRQTYVLANNRSEGNAPLTVEALADQLRA